MASVLDLVLLQQHPALGAVRANAEAILAARARFPTADLVVAPELALPGSPPGDLARNGAFQQQCAREIRHLAAATADGGPAILVGALDGDGGGAPCNASFLVDGGAILATIRAAHPACGAPFAPGEPSGAISFRGIRLGVALGGDFAHGDVRAALDEADLLLVQAALPFVHGARVARRHMLARFAGGKPLLYLNRVGAEDDLAFDGGSFALNESGVPVARLSCWDETELRLCFQQGSGLSAAALAAAEGEEEAIYHAMLVALRDYVRDGGFPGVLLGLSGGIDSALVAAVAVDALGADHVRTVLLPSPYTSAASREDATACAGLLGVRCDTVPIAPGMAAFEAMLAPLFKGSTPEGPDLARENMQARLRMLVLMGLSNRFGPMLLSTGNKSEGAVGYCTIYGDMAGGYNVLKDIYKTMVFRLARWRNGQRPRLGLGPMGRVIPERILAKPPSAELRPHQRDDDNLPPYAVLDPILHALIEEECTIADVVARGLGDRATVTKVARLVRKSEYKRRQACPGVAIGPRSFGRDWHAPLLHRFDEEG